jgi:hypothetical protein
LLCVLGEMVLVDAGHATLGLEVDALDRGSRIRLTQMHLRDRPHRLGRMAVLGHHVAELHRETGGVRRGDQLLGIRARALLEARRK